MEQIIYGVVGIIVLAVFFAAIGVTKNHREHSMERLADEVNRAVVSTRVDKRSQPRWLQKIKAAQGGYFWLPCLMCGEDFGGHEWAGDLMHDRSRGEGVCANCADEAARLNRERFPDAYGPNVIRFSIGIKPR